MPLDFLLDSGGIAGLSFGSRMRRGHKRHGKKHRKHNPGLLITIGAALTGVAKKSTGGPEKFDSLVADAQYKANFWPLNKSQVAALSGKQVQRVGLSKSSEDILEN